MNPHLWHLCHGTGVHVADGSDSAWWRSTFRKRCAGVSATTAASAFGEMSGNGLRSRCGPLAQLHRPAQALTSSIKLTEVQWLATENSEPHQQLEAIENVTNPKRPASRLTAPSDA